MPLKFVHYVAEHPVQSVVKTVSSNSTLMIPLISPTYGVNVHRRISDRILYVLDNSAMHQ